MADLLTSDTLRAHANAPETVAWSATARMLLRWAADLVDAAKAIRAERECIGYPDCDGDLVAEPHSGKCIADRACHAPKD